MKSYGVNGVEQRILSPCKATSSVGIILKLEIVCYQDLDNSDLNDLCSFK